MQNCKQCKYRLSSYSNNYYCCNKQQPVCISCRHKACKICKEQRLNILQHPKCMTCWGKIYDAKGFKDKYCGQQFCPKCLTKTFREAYQKTLGHQKNNTQMHDSSFKLPCGDTCRISDLLIFFQSYCVQCGKDFRETLDFDLKDGLKLCFMCKSCFHDKYSHAFMKCNICGCSIEKKSKAGILNENDLTLCKNCFFESQAEENYIQTNKQLNESRKKSASLYMQKQYVKTEEKSFKEQKNRPEVQVDTFFSEKRQQSNFVEKKFQQSFSQAINQKVFNQKKSDEHIKESKVEEFSTKKSSQVTNEVKKLPKKQESEVSPLRKIIQKTWKPSPDKDQKRHETKSDVKQQTRSKSVYQENVEQIQTDSQKKNLTESEKLETTKKQQGSHEYFVIHDLKNQEEQVDQEVKKQLGIENSLILKKYLSDETLVQSLTLQIPLNSLNSFVKCKQCNIQLPINLAYNLNAKPENKPRSSSFLCISSIEESLSRSRTKDSTYNCRVCYQKMIDAKSEKNSIFDQSISTNGRSFMTNTSHRSVLQDSRRQSDHLRDSYISHRKDMSQSIKKSYVSPYGLTGAKLEQHRTITQNIQNSLNSSLRRPSTPIKPSHEKITLSANQFKPQRKINEKYATEKCVFCGLHKEGLVHSLDGGKYCKECYVRKNKLLYSEPYILEKHLLRR